MTGWAAGRRIRAGEEGLSGAGRAWYRVGAFSTGDRGGMPDALWRHTVATAFR